VHELEAQTDDQPEARPSPGQREGLPAHYRMRAERHYVDHLVAPAMGTPVRLIPVANFSDGDQARAKELDALIRSIRAHGVIQPLLVRKEDTAYRVIAGRKRLYAAIAAGLAEVPCIIHQVDDEGEASLRSAESVRGDAPPQPAATTRAADPIRAAVGTKLADGVTEIAADLTRLRRTLGLARGAAKGFERAVSMDLIAAQAWRTLWLANVTAFLATGKSPEDGIAPLSTVVDDIVQGFEPESRLSRLRFTLAHSGLTSTAVDCGLVGLAFTGAVVVALSFLEEVAEPHLHVATDTIGESGFAIEIAQRQRAVPQQAADQFSSHAFSARGAGAFGLAAIALSHATAMYGGASEMTLAADPDGATVRLTFPQP
jgi:hypothetical protein